MCVCCSVRQQKCWVFGLGIVFLAIGILLIVWSPNFIMDTIYKNLPLTQNSITYDNWAVAPIPIYLDMYLFNWTNPEAAYKAGVKPNFEKLGPYVFLEKKVKEDVVWHKNKTVTFKANRTWFFLPEMSGGSADDLVTAPHLPSIAASSIIRDKPKAIKYIFSNILNRNGGALYQTHTAMEWIIDGFYDEFLDFAIKLNNSLTSQIKSNHFAWLLNRNGSKEFDGSFTIDTGQNDLSQMGELKFWNGKSQSGFFEGECGRINGSTTDLFVPRREPDEFVTIFIPDTCRILNLEPTNEEVVIEGISAWKYEATPNTFDNGQLNEDMKCYCRADKQPNDCEKTGVTDLSPCFFGAPILLSLPNFLYADEKYTNTITGLKPNPNEDKLFIIMERKLGIPLEVRGNIQVNIFVQNDSTIRILRNIQDFYAPLFIIASRALATKKLGRVLRLVLYLPQLGRDIGIGFVCLGGVLIIIGIALTMTHRWRGEKSKSLTK